MCPLPDERDSSSTQMSPPVGGWLLILCRLLLVYQPVTLALTISSALHSLSLRGLPLGVLIAVRITVAGFCIAAGRALTARQPGAVRLAQLALVLSGASDMVVYATPYFPDNRPPGDTPLYVAASLTYHTVWLVYLGRSKRVRRTY
jgi:hypothetical protein